MTSELALPLWQPLVETSFLIFIDGGAVSQMRVELSNCVNICDVFLKNVHHDVWGSDRPERVKRTYAWGGIVKFLYLRIFEAFGCMVYAISTWMNLRDIVQDIQQLLLQSWIDGHLLSCGNEFSLLFEAGRSVHFTVQFFCAPFPLRSIPARVEGM